jgi:hypothetical protein
VSDPVTNFKSEIQNKAVKLSWDKPTKEVWYYKVFRDSNLVAEIEGDVTTYTDLKGASENQTYSIIAVNYLFTESSAVKTNVRL